MKSLIIIPTYNEATNIKMLIPEIEKYYHGDILVIDDGSPDGTADEVRKLQKSRHNIFLLERSRKLGLASAYLTGFKMAIERRYEAVFEMDADFSHNPKYIPQMLSKLKEGYDLVIGSRYVEGGGISNWNKFRVFISQGGNFYARTILLCPIKDMTAGFNCYRVEVLEKIDLDKITSEGYSFQIEMKYIFFRLGFKVLEIPIIFEERREGCSKMSKKIFFEAFKQVWKFRFMNVKNLLKN